MRTIAASIQKQAREVGLNFGFDRRDFGRMFLYGVVDRKLCLACGRCSGSTPGGSQIFALCFYLNKMSFYKYVLQNLNILVIKFSIQFLLIN